MANTYQPGRNPNSHMTYADMVQQRDADFRAAGGVKTYRSPVVRSAPPPTNQAAPAPAVTPVARPATPRAAPAPAPTTGVRRSALTNDASVEDKLADNALGSHLGADGLPARWNVPTQIEGRDVSTSARLFAPTPGTVAPAPAAPTAQPPVAVAPPPDTSATISDVPAAAVRQPVPTINIPPPPVPTINLPAAEPAQPAEYGGVMGAARTLGRAARDIAGDVSSDIKSIVRQAPRALNYAAGGTRRLAEGDAERARVPTPNVNSFANSRGQPIQVGASMDAMATRRHEARRIGFSSRPATAGFPAASSPQPHGLLSRNPYTRRVFGD